MLAVSLRLSYLKNISQMKNIYVNVAGAKALFYLRRNIILSKKKAQAAVEHDTEFWQW